MDEDKIGFYSFLTNEEKILLKNNLVCKKLEKGEYLRNNMQSCVGVFIPITGRLKVSIISDEGREIILYHVRALETCILSASCVLQNISFDVYIKAEEETKGLLIPIRIFAKLQEQNIRVKNYALEFTNERFSDVMWALQQMLFLPLQKRVAIFLYDETINNKSDEFEVTHEGIAQNIGSSREVVTRSLKVLSELGILEVGRGKIKIIDRKELIKLTK